MLSVGLIAVTEDVRAAFGTMPAVGFMSTTAACQAWLELA
jgi:hypothetical protein